MIPAAKSCLPWPRPFEYITKGSAGRLISEIHRLIERDAIVRRWYDRARPGQLSIKSDIKVRITSSRRVRIRRLYWSLQNSPQVGQFQARTLVLEPDGVPGWLDFPDDPELPAASQMLASEDSCRILQYIPLRRLTVLVRDENGFYSVLKLKREGRGCDATERLLEITTQATMHSQVPKVPRVLERRTGAGAQRLSYCAGVSLAALSNQTPPTILFQECGAHLASFHNLTAAKLPEDPLADFAHLEKQVSHLCVLWPEASERLRQCLANLLRYVPSASSMQLCHGDLSAEHILYDGNTWSLIDLDLAHQGDPSRDISQLLTRLSSASAPSAYVIRRRRNALLTGYERVRPGALSKQLLEWQCCRAELESLSTAFRKDTVEEGRCNAALDRAEQHCHGFYR